MQNIVNDKPKTKKKQVKQLSIDECIEEYKNELKRNLEEIEIIKLENTEIESMIKQLEEAKLTNMNVETTDEPKISKQKGKGRGKKNIIKDEEVSNTLNF